MLIATTDRPNLLRRTLESISACRIPGRYRGTIVVENGPRVGVEAIVDEFRAPPLRAAYLYSPVPNKSRALNLALQTLKGNELVLFTDDDARVRYDWLEAYAEASRGVVEGVVYGGPFAVDYESPPPKWLTPYMPSSAVGRPMETFRPTLQGFVKFNGLNWAAFAKDILAAGYADELLGPGTLTLGQETDLQRRLWMNGIQSHTVRNAMTWHYVPVERSSSEWVLHRRYRTGITKGTRARQRIAGVRSLLRTIRLVVKSLAGTLRGWAGVASAGSNHQKAFAAYADLFTHRGVLAGLLGYTRGLPMAPEVFRPQAFADRPVTSSVDSNYSQT